MGWFFGMQNAIYPLILTVVVNVVNIALSFYLVHYLGLDVDGVAWGTVVAQYFGLLLGIVLFARRYRYLLPKTYSLTFYSIILQLRNQRTCLLN